MSRKHNYKEGVFKLKPKLKNTTFCLNISGRARTHRSIAVIRKSIKSSISQLQQVWGRGGEKCFQERKKKYFQGRKGKYFQEINKKLRDGFQGEVEDKNIGGTCVSQKGGGGGPANKSQNSKPSKFQAQRSENKAMSCS